MKRILVADHDAKAITAARRYFLTRNDIAPLFTTDVVAGLRKLGPGALEAFPDGSPILYGAVIECLWPSAKASPADLGGTGLTQEDVSEYGAILKKGAELYRSSPPLGVLLARRCGALGAPIVMTAYPTSARKAQEQLVAIQAYIIQAYAQQQGWKCYTTERVDKHQAGYWKQCVTRFENKWLQQTM
jgi:hypothetical protein